MVNVPDTGVNDETLPELATFTVMELPELFVTTLPYASRS